MTQGVVQRLLSTALADGDWLAELRCDGQGDESDPGPTMACLPARLVRAVRSGGGRVVAIGITAVRALETAARDTGAVQAPRGWTDLVITPEREVRILDGLLTACRGPRVSRCSRPLPPARVR